MNFKFSNFMAFDSKMMLIEVVDNLMSNKNDKKKSVHLLLKNGRNPPDHARPNGIIRVRALYMHFLDVNKQIQKQ